MKLVDIINSLGEMKNLSIEIKRDLGDFVEYMTINKISNGIVYYDKTDLFPDGLDEDLEDLSINELYAIIMSF
jgi:hypothetical protein